MKIAALAVAAFVFAACGKAPPPAPEPPTPQAVGAELATFPQLFVPISSTTWASMQEAIAAKDHTRTAANRHPQPYAHATLQVGGQDTAVMVAYTGVFLAPAPIPLQPMSVQQFLRAFGADPEASLAGVVAPKGTIYFTREQLVDVIAAARAAGAVAEDLPYGEVRGAGRR